MSAWGLREAEELTTTDNQIAWVVAIAVAHMTGDATEFSVRQNDAALSLATKRMNHSQEAEIETDTVTTLPQNSPRRTFDLQYLSLSSYVRLCTLISVCLGLVVSLLFFLLDVLGMDTSFQWGPIAFSDTESGVIVLFVGPFIFGAIGLVGSLFSYRLFLWALRTFLGIPLTGTWKELKRSEEEKSNRPPA
jgi:hypothetical protein